MELGMTIRVESVTNTGDGLEILWADESDIDYPTGVIEARMSRIPHDVIPNELVTDLVDCVLQILDAARLHRNRVADTFTAPR
jgi:hypothetical protein